MDSGGGDRRPGDADEDDTSTGADGPVFRFDPDDSSATGSLFGDVPDLEPGDVDSLFGDVPDLAPGETSEVFSAEGLGTSGAAEASPPPTPEPALAMVDDEVGAADGVVDDAVVDAELVDEAADDGAADSSASQDAEDAEVIALAPEAAEGGDDEPAFRFEDPPNDATGPLPHWTEPATGVLQLGDPEPEAAAPNLDPGVAFRRSEVADEESLEAWTAMDTPRSVWSDGTSEPDPEPIRIGAATGPPTTTGVWQEPQEQADDYDLPVRDGAGRDLPSAFLTGGALAAVALAVLRFGPPGVVVAFVAALAVLAVGELFTSLRRAGHRPAHLLGLVATGGLILGAFWKGAAAYPVVLALLVLFTFASYVIEPVQHPLSGITLTIGGVMWVGFGASFAALMLKGTHGTGAFLAAVVGTVAHDLFAYAVGRVAGRSQLAPELSPNKTWEGLFGGMVGAVIGVGTMGLFGVAPVDQLLDALLVGVAIAIAAPIGDLAESMIKRDIGVKDMGSILPGHGGFLDRFDGLLFSLPTVWLMLLALDLAPVGLAI